MNWDLDFWGKQRDLIHEAREQTTALALDEQGARLALAGALAQAYVDLYRNYALADIAQDSVQQREHIRTLTSQRVHAGLDTNVELRQADSAVPQSEVQLAQAQASQALAVHQLAALSGEGAEAYAAITRPSLNIDAALPLPASLPADLLGRRPDVLAAKARVEAAIAGRAAAKAEVLPGREPDRLCRLPVNRLCGPGPRRLRHLRHRPGPEPAPVRRRPAQGQLPRQHRRAGCGGGQLQPDRARRRAAPSSRPDQQPAGAADRAGGAAEGRAGRRRSRAYRLAEERYAAGLTGYLTVLTADTQVLSARRAMVDLAATQAIDRVTLLLALGGSFKPDAAMVAAAAPNTQPSAQQAQNPQESSHE